MIFSTNREEPKQETWTMHLERMDFSTLAKSLVENQQSRKVLSWPKLSEWQQRISEVHVKIGYILKVMKRIDEALESFRQAIAIIVRLSESNPSDMNLADSLACTHMKICECLTINNRLDEAQRHLDISISIIETLRKKMKGESTFEINYAGILATKGELLERMNSFSEALKIYLECQNIFEDHLNKSQLSVEAKFFYASICEHIGVLYFTKLQDVRAAEIAFRRFLDIASALSETAPERADCQNVLWIAYSRMGSFIESSKGLKESRVWWKKAYEQLDLMRQCGTLKPSDAATLNEVRCRAGL